MALAITIILIATVGFANISDGLIKTPWLEISCNCKKQLKYPHIREVGSETRHLQWDPKPCTQNPSHRWDLVSKTKDLKGGTCYPGPGAHLIDGMRELTLGTLKMGSGTQYVVLWKQIFESLNLTAWALLIFYYLNELVFPSSCKNTNLISTMQPL